jgi:hypothetical protein
MFLSTEELERLTERKRASAQCRALDAMGVVYLRREDGHPRVLRSLVERIMGGESILAEPELELCFEPTKKKRPAPSALRSL